jgi:hypothetical protein
VAELPAGNDSYSPRRLAAANHLQSVLGVQKHNLNYGQIGAVRSL